MKEGEIPPHMAPRTNNYVSDTNKEMKVDEYPWLDVDDKRLHLPAREIIECKVNIKDSRLVQEQQARIYDLMGEHYDTFSL